MTASMAPAQLVRSWQLLLPRAERICGAFSAGSGAVRKRSRKLPTSAQRVHWPPRYVVPQTLQGWVDRASPRNCHHASSSVRPMPLIAGLCPGVSTLHLSKRGVARDRVLSTEWMRSESVVMAGTSERISRMTKLASAPQGDERLRQRRTARLTAVVETL